MQYNRICGLALQVKSVEGIIAGCCMYPALQEGWKVKTEPVSAEEIKPGDIIVFGRNVLTCHRILAKMSWLNTMYLMHKGDNSSMGGIFKAASTVAKVIEVSDKEGRTVIPAKWQRSSCGMHTAASIYTALYLIKLFFCGEKENHFSRFVNKQFWKVIYLAGLNKGTHNEI